MHDIRKNRAKEKLKNGESVIAISCTDTDMVDFLGSSGAVDVIWIEMEHSHLTNNDLIVHIMAFRGTNTVAMMRVP